MNPPKIGIIAIFIGASVITFAHGPAHIQARQGAPSPGSTEGDFDFLLQFGRPKFHQRGKVELSPVMNWFPNSGFCNHHER